MQEAANKQKRITLKTLHEMLNGMSVELAEKVHLLFMANYIDYSDYEFRDENQVESYRWCVSIRWTVYCPSHKKSVPLPQIFDSLIICDNVQQNSTYLIIL